MQTPAHDPVELHAGPLGPSDFVVRGVVGKEAMSTPYRFRVDVCSPLAWGELYRAVFSEAALLRFRGAGSRERGVFGLISDVTGGSRRDAEGQFRYRLTLVPRIWLLTQRHMSRVFQERSIQDIVEAILGPRRIAVKWSLAKPTANRAYCVQYNETDYDFVHRLAMHYGLFYYFQQPEEDEVGEAIRLGIGHDDAPRETLVFGDTHTAYAPISGGAPCLALPLRSGNNVERDESILKFDLRRRIRPTRVELRDYDYERPKLARRAELDVRRGLAPHGAPPEPAIGPQITVYSHNADAEEAAASIGFAKTHLEQLRAKVLTGSGRSSSCGLSPGHLFDLDDEVATDHNGTYAVTEVTHRIRVPRKSDRATVTQTYSNRFACVPSRVAFLIEQTPPRLQQVLETATVVGPGQKEGTAYTDPMGRVKVHFHWDREGVANEHASCFIRPSQPWAGQSWGVQFLPRVGMEVLVGFLGGDVDMPVIMGAVHNADHPPPFVLPAEAMVSGIVTHSVTETPGSPTESNELRFDDREGAQSLLVRGGRSLQLQSGQDTSILVGATVPSDLAWRVTRDATFDVAGALHHRTGGRRTEECSAGRSITVDGPDALYVEGDHRTTVTGHHSLETRGGISIRSEAAVELRTGSDLMVNVGGDEARTIDGNVATRVGGDMTAQTSGGFSVGADASILLCARDGIKLVCGETSLELGPKGVILESAHIVFKGKKLAAYAEDCSITVEDGALEAVATKRISMHSETELSVATKSAYLGIKEANGGEVVGGGKRVLWAGGKAKLILADDAKLVGSSVKLQPPGSQGNYTFANPKLEKLATSWVALSLKSHLGAPMAGARFTLTMADGAEVVGVLDGDGYARVPALPGKATVCFPDYDASAWGAGTVEASGGSGPRMHVVEPGEDAASIAARFGFPSHTSVWDAPDNSELVTHRPNPYQLFPGDILWVPRVARGHADLAEQSETPFTLRVPTRMLECALLDSDHKPRSGLDYRIECLGSEIRGTTGTDGAIRHELPAQAATALLVVQGDEPRTIRLSGINPMTHVPDGGASGAAQRLLGLGYAPGPEDGSNGAMLRLAILSFQRDHNQKMTGTLDEEFIQALLDRYGV